MELPPMTFEEKGLIQKWLGFYEALARGERRPDNQAQEHFTAVFQGRAKVETAHEWAYLKWRRQNRVETSGEARTDLEVPAGQRTYPSRMDEKFDQTWEDPDPHWR